MARFTKESLEVLRQRIDLPDLLSQYIQLKRAGAAFKALCPFHDERSPSFVVNKGDSHYHCFGCGAHGDAIQFLMHHLKLGFSEAVQQLAERFQVPLEKVEGGFDAKETNRSRLKEATALATRFYQCYLLHTQEGKEALDYLFRRSISLDFIIAFQVGLAPKQEGLFRKVMQEAGFTDDILLETGLIAERNGRMRDFFSQRLMFPILDPTGASLGFSARKFREETFGGKYINTKETPLFKKSRVLFGMHASRRRIIKQKQAIVVEGGLDALRMIFHGFDITVAAMGTAFGEEHVRELVQLGLTRVFLLLDGDEAGIEASLKVGNLFQRKGVEVLVGRFPPASDPDTVLVKRGPLGIMDVLMQAQDYLHFFVERLSKDMRSDSPAEKNQMLIKAVQSIREWDDPVMVHESLKKLAHLTKVPEELLGVGGIVSPSYQFKRSAAASATGQVNPDRVLEADLLRWLVLCGSSVSALCRQNLTESDFYVPVAQKMYLYVLKMYEESRHLDLLLMASEVDDEELQPFLAEITNKKINRDKAQEGIAETILRIKERNWMLEKEQIKMKIHSGQASEDEVMELVRKFDALNKSSPSLKSINEATANL
ncbi:MAG: DNA primase [Verrucomicrobia bacterium]|nr:DNA primase [Verrucomicrobiota bacterium]